MVLQVPVAFLPLSLRHLVILDSMRASLVSFQEDGPDSKSIRWITSLVQHQRQDLRYYATAARLINIGISRKIDRDKRATIAERAEIICSIKCERSPVAKHTFNS